MTAKPTQRAQIIPPSSHPTKPAPTWQADLSLGAIDTAYSNTIDGAALRLVDAAAEGIRKATPAWIVNNSSRLTFGMQFTANAIGIWAADKWYNNKSLTTAAWLGLGSSVMGVLFNEKPQTQEELDRYKEMNPLEYLGNRMVESVQFWKYPTRFVSFVQMATGIFQMRGAWQKSGMAYFTKGGLTTLGAAIINLVPDQERAWQLSSIPFGYRAFPSGINAWQEYKHGFPAKGVEKGNWAGLLKFGVNQLSQLTGTLYGGVNKDEFGNIYRKADHMPDTLKEELANSDDPFELVDKITRDASGSASLKDIEHQAKLAEMAIEKTA